MTRTLIATIFLVAVATAGCGGHDPKSANKGGDTECSAFLKMTPAGRHDVIEKMGYAPEYTTNAREVALALDVCRREEEHRARLNPPGYDLTVNEATGP